MATAIVSALVMVTQIASGFCLFPLLWMISEWLYLKRQEQKNFIFPHKHHIILCVLAIAVVTLLTFFASSLNALVSIVIIFVLGLSYIVGGVIDCWFQVWKMSRSSIPQISHTNPGLLYLIATVPTVLYASGCLLIAIVTIGIVRIFFFTLDNLVPLFLLVEVVIGVIGGIFITYRWKFVKWR